MNTKKSGFLLYPLQVLLVILIIISLFYFRLVIFHENVTEPVDFGFALIEERFDIEIPVYKPRHNITNRSIAQSTVTKHNPAMNREGNYNETEVEEIVSPTENHSTELIQSDEQLELQQQLDESETAAETISEKVVSVSRQDNIQDSGAVEQLSEQLSKLTEKVDRIYAGTEGKVDVDNKLDQLFTLIEEIRNNQSHFTVSVNDKLIEDDTSVQTDDVDSLLDRARKSFWKGNKDLSEKLYLNLVEIEQQNPDAFGELGNVYFSQGKWKQAGEAYYQAALRLIDMNQTQQLTYLLRIIEGLDQESAMKLRQKMSGKGMG